MKSREVEGQAAEALRSLVERNPEIMVDEIVFGPPGPGHPVDILASISAFGRHHKLACEVRSNGQPRHVRNAILYVRDYVSNLEFDAAPMVSAPFLSEQSRALCIKSGVGYLDLHGNAFLQVPGILIEISVPGEPPAERRDLKSLFRPKAAQILRVMLRKPKRAWRVTELACAASASLGHVSNVRRALLSREWAEELSDGVVLSRSGCSAGRMACRLSPSRRRRGETLYQPSWNGLRGRGQSGLLVARVAQIAGILIIFGRSLDRAIRKNGYRVLPCQPGGGGADCGHAESVRC